MRDRTRSIAAIAVGLLAVAPLARASETKKAEPFVGVTHYQIVQKATGDDAPPKLPRPAVVNVLEIDTTAPGIRFEMSPGNGDAPGEVTRAKTRDFLDKAGAQIGINVGFYDTKAKYGQPLDTDLMNLAASDGDIYSRALNAGEWVFDVSKDNKARIAKADGPDAATIAGGTRVYNAAGGNQPMLRGGEVVTPPDDGYTKALNPHTAVGVSKDGTKVYLAVVDGRQEGYSEGLRTDEFAQLLKHFGAWDAINYDGGGSTTMAVDDSDDGKPDSRLLNSPSDNSSPTRPGTDRVVANSLAVFAKFKPGYTPLAAPPRPKGEPELALLKAKTVLDDFEAGLGHFAQPIGTSGSNKGVDPKKSSAGLDWSVQHGGKVALKLAIVADAATKDDLQLRLLSGNASPPANTVDGKAMGNDGFVGFWLRRDPDKKGPLFVSILVNDGTPDTKALERSPSVEVKPDGQWHLYQWGLNEDARWSNYNNGNGKIDGPNVFLNSVLFRSAKENDKGGGPSDATVWMDDVTYNPGGRLE